MWSVLFNLNTWVGASFAAIIVSLGAILWYGPQQYRIAETETATRLTQEYNDAVDNLVDPADKAVARQVHCVATGGVWFAGRGFCDHGRDTSDDSVDRWNIFD